MNKNNKGKLKAPPNGGMARQCYKEDNVVKIVFQV